MDGFVALFLLIFSIEEATSYDFNYTGDGAGRHLLDFTLRNPVPIGVLTTSSGEPVEVRQTLTINNDFANQYHMDVMTHFDRERVKERVLFAKGISAHGYFEVTNDISQYTKADVFNGIGKKTPVTTRFSIDIPNHGGSELGRNSRGFAVKFYTQEGNLDFGGVQIPVYMDRDPMEVGSFLHAFKRNPRTNLYDKTQVWDYLTLKPLSLNYFLWTRSDYGSPNGYRKMDGFPIHTYEIHNYHGETFYVKFNFRTEQGLANLTSVQNRAIGPSDPDYFTRDLYNALYEKKYPVWRLEMDVLTTDAKKLGFNPFDLTVLWREGTYRTVPIGRLVLDRTVVNHFAESEQIALNPANLVPGIVGPVDRIFKARRFSYKDAHNYRLGTNHNKIAINLPRYAKTYDRDGDPPVGDNMKDEPNYYPNSFNGPIPYVDETKPDRTLLVLDSNAVDLREPSYFYNHVIRNDAHRQRLADNIAETLQPVLPNIARRALQLLSIIDMDLGARVARSLRLLKAVEIKVSFEERLQQDAQCFQRNPIQILKRNH